ncbi:MAG TPA: hypothetical protein VNO30_36505 [Kofleriaceae bacterium]|nr:hypothetical protein [Kofleriaceae bacterium]
MPVHAPNVAPRDGCRSRALYSVPAANQRGGFGHERGQILNVDTRVVVMIAR